ncbi:tetratricopeptide repeat protein [Bacteroidales bacterium OttesenSCG-928-M11]|nr:tetratricopeptide repeat protein [Bacteroidales bacterium OttesenSCG-928-M11]
MMNPSFSFTKDSLADLESILDEYPYFQTARFLYTLNLKELRDSRFSSELRKTACCLNNRERLFLLLEKDSFSPDLINRLEQIEESASGSSFDLIDLFLRDKPQETDSLKLIERSDVVAADYVSLLSSDLPEEKGDDYSPMQHQDAIDRFLEKDKTEPIRIELKEEDTSEEDKLPDLDNFEEESFFSETLAKIYLKQKKYDKALEIIRQLYLRNPEKNRYFADQIRFLEKLIINR